MSSGNPGGEPEKTGGAWCAALAARLRKTGGNHLRLACAHTTLVIREAMRQHWIARNRAKTGPAALSYQRQSSCLGCPEAPLTRHWGPRRHA